MIVLFIEKNCAVMEMYKEMDDDNKYTKHEKAVNILKRRTCMKNCLVCMDTGVFILCCLGMAFFVILLKSAFFINNHCHVTFKYSNADFATVNVSTIERVADEYGFTIIEVGHHINLLKGETRPTVIIELHKSDSDCENTKNKIDKLLHFHTNTTHP